MMQMLVAGGLEELSDHIRKPDEDKELVEDTIVIFMTDNGPNTWRYNAGLRGKKGHLYEGGIRVPCFIRWPGKLETLKIDKPLAHIDILPTLAEWCGLEGVDKLSLDGRSFEFVKDNKLKKIGPAITPVKI